MTEEIIIFEQDGDIVGITKEGKYFESYKTTKNVAILRGAGLYIQRLEQENEKLKNKNMCRETCEYFKRICNKNTLLIKYRSVLEEINLIIDKLKQQYDYMEDYSEIKEIEKKINEVLNENTEN